MTLSFSWQELEPVRKGLLSIENISRRIRKKNSRSQKLIVHILNWPLPQRGFLVPIQMNELMNEWINLQSYSIEKSQLGRGRPVGYIQSAGKELNLNTGLRTNPVSSKVESFNPGPLDYKHNTLTTDYTDYTTSVI